MTLKTSQGEPIIIEAEEGSMGEVPSSSPKRSQVINKTKRVRQVLGEASEEGEAMEEADQGVGLLECSLVDALIATRWDTKPLDALKKGVVSKEGTEESTWHMKMIIKATMKVGVLQIQSMEKTKCLIGPC